ncbi:hypothetical protein H257_12243 [Aphanomyces astaci]|uniref:Coiled-coil domain-containing protein 12 n=1 Tax=Aphanomyces astaci TaxID=112090 RepID=W4G1H9_APHAT|nr:hypothetical protein H257_12243 [Aphanomyces astaci]ETV72909.1 hypothetical protein H257_12243 [Aphanomyces astaci]RQM30925.1 hypothetical protein B5M09_008177 [Aphanomyces astaci]|eukprot:XP_009837695.1 hypothetical protein H257_12243 [Aphanomyces astaci]
MDQADRAKRLKALRDARDKKEGFVPAEEKEEVVVVKDVSLTAQEGSVSPAGDVATSDDNTTDEVLTIAPKKPTWDLERGLEKQMKKLERRTQNAIVEILREKMEREMQNDEDDGSDEDAEAA